jgi:hypothetical protein
VVDYLQQQLQTWLKWLLTAAEAPYFQSRVALDGGIRETKQRDWCFDAHVDFGLVMDNASKE